MPLSGKQIFAQYACGLRNGADVLVKGGLRSGGYVGVVHRFYRHQADSIFELDRPERSDLPADGRPVSKVLPSQGHYLPASTMLTVRAGRSGVGEEGVGCRTDGCSGGTAMQRHRVCAATTSQERGPPWHWQVKQPFRQTGGFVVWKPAPFERCVGHSIAGQVYRYETGQWLE